MIEKLANKYFNSVFLRCDDIKKKISHSRVSFWKIDQGRKRISIIDREKEKEDIQFGYKQMKMTKWKRSDIASGNSFLFSATRAEKKKWKLPS